MALTVMPSDGFISRLLQQAHRPAPAPAPEASKSSSAADQMSISQEARQSSQSADNNQRLESKLLEMYNQKGGV